MTPLVRRYIKTSFVFLLAGLLLGAYIVSEFVLDAIRPASSSRRTPTCSWSASC